jgi:hypothetical protein
VSDEQINTSDTPNITPQEPTLPLEEAPAPPANQAPPAPVKPSVPQDLPEADDYEERLERLGGEPAPVITPEEFARLQKAGQVHIDARGRVQTARRTDAEAGVSLRKRRAWYGG